MPLRLLRLAAKHPLAALAFAIAVPLLLLFSVVRFAVPLDAAALDGNPRTVLGRAWFDRFPDKATDEVDLWIWFGGGIGVHDKGSAWRATYDRFEFERQNDKLAMTYLQDKKSFDARFKVTRCNDNPPFDLCLDVSPPLPSSDGRTRYYGFGRRDDMESRIPSSKAEFEAAEVRARGAR
jgi:hypothetical protein